MKRVGILKIIILIVLATPYSFFLKGEVENYIFSDVKENGGVPMKNIRDVSKDLFDSVLRVDEEYKKEVVGNVTEFAEKFETIPIEIPQSTGKNYDPCIRNDDCQNSICRQMVNPSSQTMETRCCPREGCPLVSQMFTTDDANLCRSGIIDPDTHRCTDKRPITNADIISIHLPIFGLDPSRHQLSNMPARTILDIFNTYGNNVYFSGKNSKIELIFESTDRLSGTKKEPLLFFVLDRRPKTYNAIMINPSYRNALNDLKQQEHMLILYLDSVQNCNSIQHQQRIGTSSLSQKLRQDGFQYVQKENILDQKFYAHYHQNQLVMNGCTQETERILERTLDQLLLSYVDLHQKELQKDPQMDACLKIKKNKNNDKDFLQCIRTLQIQQTNTIPKEEYDPCTYDSECNGALVCPYGVCAPPHKRKWEEWPCRSSEECEEDLVCSSTQKACVRTVHLPSSSVKSLLRPLSTLPSPSKSWNEQRIQNILKKWLILRQENEKDNDLPVYIVVAPEQREHILKYELPLVILLLLLPSAYVCLSLFFAVLSVVCRSLWDLIRVSLLLMCGGSMILMSLSLSLWALLYLLPILLLPPVSYFLLIARPKQKEEQQKSIWGRKGIKLFLLSILVLVVGWGSFWKQWLPLSPQSIILPLSIFLLILLPTQIKRKKNQQQQQEEQRKNI